MSAGQARRANVEPGGSTVPALHEECGNLTPAHFPPGLCAILAVPLTSTCYKPHDTWGIVIVLELLIIF